MGTALLVAWGCGVGGIVGCVAASAFGSRGMVPVVADGEGVDRGAVAARLCVATEGRLSEQQVA